MIRANKQATLSVLMVVIASSLRRARGALDYGTQNTAEKCHVCMQLQPRILQALRMPLYQLHASPQAK